MDWGFLLHPETTLRKLYDETHNGPGEPAVSHAVPVLTRYRDQLDRSGERLQQAMRGIGADWRGRAADKASAAVRQMVRWAGQSGGPAGNAARDNVGHYGASFSVFRDKVEPPVPVPNVNFTTNPLLLTEEGGSAVAAALENYRRLANAGVAYLRHRANANSALDAIVEPGAVPDVVNRVGQPANQLGSGDNEDSPPGGSHHGPPGDGQSNRPGADRNRPGGRPGQGGEPGQGGRPGQGGDQGQGGRPGQGGIPGQGGRPVVPGDTHTHPASDTPPISPADPSPEPTTPRPVPGKPTPPADPTPLPPPSPYPPYQPGRIARALGTTVHDAPQPRSPVGPATDPTRQATLTAAAERPTTGPVGMPVGGAGARGQEREHKNRTYLPSDEPFRADIDHLVTDPVLGPADTDVHDEPGRST